MRSKSEIKIDESNSSFHLNFFQTNTFELNRIFELKVFCRLFNLHWFRVHDLKILNEPFYVIIFRID